MVFREYLSKFTERQPSYIDLFPAFLLDKKLDNLDSTYLADAIQEIYHDRKVSFWTGKLNITEAEYQQEQRFFRSLMDDVVARNN